MNPFSIENLQENKNKILFGTLVLITLIAVIFLFTTGGSGESRPGSVPYATPYVPNKDAEGFVPLLNENNKLHKSMLALQQLDEKYVTILSESGNKAALDNINEQIKKHEQQFSRKLDSLSFSVLNMAEDSLSKAYKQLVSYFKQSLNNRRSTSNFFRTASASNRADFKPDQLDLLKMKRLLDEKNNQIEILEEELQQNTAIKNILPSGTTQEITAAKDDKTTLALNTAYNNLKQDYENLLQQNQANKQNSNDEAALTKKTNLLQQKLSQLNAELRLAAVDCNLSRVDAGKIIYTSRQRKELLSETSVILKDLSAVDDALIQKKVRDKIIRLNQVAANSRD